MDNLDRSQDFKLDTMAYIRRGQSKQDSGDINGAIDDFDRAIEINPDFALAYFHRGSAKSDLEDLVGALADLDRAIQIDDPSLDGAYIERANLRLHDLHPNLNRFCYNRANLKYQKFQDYRGALADYDRVIILNPNHAVCYYNRGVLKFRELQDFPGALVDFNDAIRLNPNNANAYYNRGNLKCNRLQDEAGGIADLQQAGKVYQQQGNIAFHQRVLDRLQELQPNSERIESVPLNNVEDLCNNIQSNLESNGAINDNDRSQAFKLDHAPAYIVRGYDKLELGDIYGAIYNFDRAIELDPNNDLAYICRGQAKRDSRDINGAIDDYDRAEQLNPNNAGLYTDRGSLRSRIYPVQSAVTENVVPINEADIDLDAMPQNIMQKVEKAIQDKLIIIHTNNYKTVRLPDSMIRRLPDSIIGLTQLTILNLCNCQLNNLPENIGDLTNLTGIKLHSNQLKTLPKSIGNFVNVTKLTLHDNSLISLPESIGNLKNLTELTLHNNSLTNLPESIGNLKKLTELTLHNNSLTNLPESIGNLTNLKQLNLRYNQLTSLPDNIANLHELTDLDITGNSLEENSLAYLVNILIRLTNLKNLSSDNYQLYVHYKDRLREQEIGTVRVDLVTSLNLSKEKTLDKFDRPQDFKLDALAYIVRGYNQLKESWLSYSIKDFDRAIELDPNNDLGYIGRGQAKQYTGDINGAIDDYYRAEELNPNNAGLSTTGGSLRSKIDKAEAEAILNSHYQAYCHRGNAKSSLGDFRGAIAEFDRAVELMEIASIFDTNDRDLAYTYRGKAKLNLGDIYGAIDDYNRCDRSNPEVYTNRISLRAEIETLQKAINDNMTPINETNQQIASADFDPIQDIESISPDLSDRGCPIDEDLGDVENIQAYLADIDGSDNLTSLDLSDNDLEKLPDNITDLTRLTHLYLGGNKLSTLPTLIDKEIDDYFFDRMVRGSHLEDYDFHNYDRLKYQPKSIDTLTNITNLISLDLSNNELEFLPTSIDNLTKLIYLNLSNNKLRFLPYSISNLTNLAYLNLSENSLYELPDWIADEEEHCGLDLTDPKNNEEAVSYSIHYLTNLTNLKYLNLSGNDLRSIPNKIDNLTKLTHLDLNNNSLHYLPESFGNLASLIELNLQDNCLSKLPESFAKLTNLKTIYIDSYKLDILPESIKNIVNLKILSKPSC
jgi:Leucine-rich repeat (LRR) protein